MPGSDDSDVQGHRLQHDLHAKPVQPRHPRGSRSGGAPVLAFGGDSVLSRLEVLPVQHVRTHLHGELQAASAGVQVRVRTRPRWVRAADEVGLTVVSWVVVVVVCL